MSTHGLVYLLIVTDGAVLHAIHPDALGPDESRAIEGVIHRHVLGVEPGLDAPTDSIRRTALVEMARASGFTGDLCGRCGNLQMQRSGACLTCHACGSTTGCS